MPSLSPAVLQFCSRSGLQGSIHLHSLSLRVPIKMETGKALTPDHGLSDSSVLELHTVPLPKGTLLRCEPSSENLCASRPHHLCPACSPGRLMLVQSLRFRLYLEALQKTSLMRRMLERSEEQERKQVWLPSFFWQGTLLSTWPCIYHPHSDSDTGL